MGFFSYDCKRCNHPLLSSYVVSPVNDWMSHVVAIEGPVIGARDGVVGTFDGYGRIYIQSVFGRPKHFDEGIYEIPSGYDDPAYRALRASVTDSQGILLPPLGPKDNDPWWEGRVPGPDRRRLTNVEVTEYRRREEAARGTPASVWHLACWQVEGEPGYSGHSRTASDQGYFFDPGEHDLPDPRIGTSLAPNETTDETLRRSRELERMLTTAFDTQKLRAEVRPHDPATVYLLGGVQLQQRPGGAGWDLYVPRPASDVLQLQRRYPDRERAWCHLVDLAREMPAGGQSTPFFEITDLRDGSVILLPAEWDPRAGIGRGGRFLVAWMPDQGVFSEAGWGQATTTINTMLIDGGLALGPPERAHGDLYWLDKLPHDDPMLEEVDGNQVIARWRMVMPQRDDGGDTFVAILLTLLGVLL